jgi:CBS domain containing-hemolysin-like protein
LLVLVNAAYVAGEFSLVAVDRGRVQRLSDDGKRRARGVLRSLRELSFQLSAAQLGITVVSIVIGFVVEPTIGDALDPVFSALGMSDAAGHRVSLVVALVLVTVLQMVAGELIPKGIAIDRPEGTAMALAGALRAWSRALGPMIRFLNGTANAVLRLFRIHPQEEGGQARSLAELGLLIRSSADTLDLAEDEVRMLTRAIRFTARTAAEVLVPRIDVIAVPGDTTLAELVVRAGETGHSRFPVTGTGIDDVVGVVHAKDVLATRPSARPSTPVTAVMKPALFVPETRELDALLTDLRRAGSQLAVVVDEHGGTAGIITSEDILEELVGEIEDEYDRRAPAAAPPGGAEPVTGARAERPAEVLLSGAARPEEVEERIGLVLPEGDYETVAGFVLTRLGRIPEVGERCLLDGYELEVVEMDGLRIAAVRIRRR